MSPAVPSMLNSSDRHGWNSWRHGPHTGPGTQVECHMRLCLAATAGRDTLVTLIGSELLLVEAAYGPVKRTQSNTVHHLANHSDLNCVDLRRRGELVAAFLIMRANDTARAASSGRRRVPVDVFIMEELLPPAEYSTLLYSQRILLDIQFYRGHGGEKHKFVARFKNYGNWVRPCH